MSSSVQLAVERFQGSLVVVFGVDGSGKSTLLDFLAKTFAEIGREPLKAKQPRREVRDRPHFYRFYHEPDRRHEVDYRAIECEVMADRLHHQKSEILPHLAKPSGVVLLDQYVYSAIAHMRLAGLANEVWFDDLSRYLVKPTLSIHVSAPLEVITTRLNSRVNKRSRFYEEERLRTLHREYQAVADANDVATLDTAGPLEETQAAALALLVEADVLLGPSGDL